MHPTYSRGWLWLCCFNQTYSVWWLLCSQSIHIFCCPFLQHFLWNPSALQHWILFPQELPSTLPPFLDLTFLKTWSRLFPPMKCLRPQLFHPLSVQEPVCLFNINPQLPTHRKCKFAVGCQAACWRPDDVHSEGTWLSEEQAVAVVGFSFTRSVGYNAAVLSHHLNHTLLPIWTHMKPIIFWLFCHKFCKPSEGSTTLLSPERRVSRLNKRSYDLTHVWQPGILFTL